MCFSCALSVCVRVGVFAAIGKSSSNATASASAQASNDRAGSNCARLCVLAFVLFERSCVLFEMSSWSQLAQRSAEISLRLEDFERASCEQLIELTLHRTPNQSAARRFRPLELTNSAPHSWRALSLSLSRSLCRCHWLAAAVNAPSLLPCCLHRGAHTQCFCMQKLQSCAENRKRAIN